MPTDPDEARAAAERILHDVAIHEDGDVDDSLVRFEDDLTTVATFVMEAADREARLTAALEAMTESSDGLLRQRDQYMDRVGIMAPALEEIKACIDHLYSERNPSNIPMLPPGLMPYAGPISIIARMVDQALAPSSGGSEG